MGVLIFLLTFLNIKKEKKKIIYAPNDRVFNAAEVKK